MDVFYMLAGVRALVQNQTVAADGYPFPSRHLLGHHENLSHHWHLPRAHVRQGREVLDGYDEQVDGRLGGAYLL